jgi:hypothetical protein
MHTNIEIEAVDIRDNLLVALWQLDCYHTEAAYGELRIYEPECLGPFYTVDHRFIIVAVNTDQLPSGRTVEFFKSRKSRAVIRGHLGSNVETIPEDGVIYFRVPAQHIIKRLAA